MVSKRGCMGWLQKRTNLEKTLLSLSSLLFLTLFLMIVIGIAFKGNQSGDSSDENEMCFSSDCIKAAGDVLASMQADADPCTDFYDFACGKYGEEPGQTASVSSRSTESVYFTLKNVLESDDDQLEVDGLHDVKSFYNSCVQFGSFRRDVQETGSSLMNLMNDVGIGIWPVIDSLYDTKMFSLERILASLVLLDVPVVFKMEVVPDEHLTSSYIIKISPGGPRESGRSQNEIRNDVHLRSSVLASFLNLGATTSANTDLGDILMIDGTFAKIEQDKNTSCDDVTLLAPQEATQQLNMLIPKIKWDIIFSEIRHATGLRGSFAVKLLCKKKIRDYVVHLNDWSERSAANYLGWRFFSKFAEHVIPTFERSHSGTMPRWRVCLELMEKFASPLMAELLTRKMMNDEIKETVERISESVLSSAHSLVSSSSWLSASPLKSRILEKVARIRIRYPFHKEDLNGDAPLRIPQVEASNFTAFVIHRQRQWVIEKFKRLSQDSEVSDDAPEPWRPVLTARSDSLTRDSTAYVYFDKLTSPFIRLHGSQWLHFGGFGVSVAREISKVLFSTNSVGSENGKLWKIWKQSKNSSDCFDTSLLEEIEEAEEREMLLKDIFLDQSALEMAYETAVASHSSQPHGLPGVDLSKEKLFFLAYAQTLCNADSSSETSEENIPVKDKLKSVLSHLDPFNRAFSCGNPSPQCLIWT